MRRRVRHPPRRRIGTEAPEIHQRPHRHVVGAATVFGKAEGVRQHFAELGIDIDPLAAVVIVEATQRRVGSIGAERQVHRVEPRLHAGAQVFGGRGQWARDLHRPGAAHGLPGQQRFTATGGCVRASGQREAGHMR